MTAQSFPYGRLYRFISMVLCLTVLASSIPQQGWSLLFGVRTVHAVSTKDNFSSMLPGGTNSPLDQAMQIAGLDQVNMFDSNGEPNGMLMDLGAMRAPVQREPASLANPISVSRVQSAYRAADALAGTLVVTFTVINNRPPAIAPQLPNPTTATMTDTIEAVSKIDFSNDPNTIRNVILADTLTEHSTFVTSSPLPDRAGAQHIWNLGDIPPLGTTTATLTLHIPTSVANFVDLDTGVTAWGTLQGRAVNAQAPPASLAPDTIEGVPIGDWLKWTVDADTFDEYMFAKAAELGQDPVRMFEYMHSLGYESYKGSLRGTRGTLWSEAGNSLDKASLLIAMLRASGIPARYRHGQLGKPLAQVLILSMFSKPTQMIGHIPASTEVSDPANDPKLLEETQDHWWVEAYLPDQGWRNLDPSFGGAIVGQTFITSDNAANDGTDRIAEVPDNLRHKVVLKVKVEHLEDFPPGRALPITYPLHATFNTVELVGKPVTLGHLVNSFDSSLDNGFCECGGFRVIQTTYTPYFSIGDQGIQGQPFQDTISNFPFGTSRITAEWLLFDIRDANGSVQHYEREVFDKIGFDKRHTEDTTSSFEIGNSDSGLTETDLLTVLFAPGKISRKALDRQLPSAYKAFRDVSQASSKYNGLYFTRAEKLVATRELNYFLKEAISKLHLVEALQFYALFDQQSDATSSALLTHAYADTTRFVALSSDQRKTNDTSNELALSMDVLQNQVRSVVFPGQSEQAKFAINQFNGLLNGAVEYYLSSGLRNGNSSISVYKVFETAQSQGVPIKAITTDNAYEIAELDLSSEARARINEAVNRGQLVVTPEEMVTVGGITTVGWYEIDPGTQVTIDTMENGRHLWLETKLLANKILDKGEAIGFISGFLVADFSFFVVASTAMQEGKEVAAWLSAKIGATSVLILGAIAVTAGSIIALSTGDPSKLFSKARNITSNFTLAYMVTSSLFWSIIYVAVEDPPIPPFLVSAVAATPRRNTQTTLIPVDGSDINGQMDVDIALTTNLLYANGRFAEENQVGSRHALRFQNLTAHSVNIYDSNGVLLDISESIRYFGQPTTGVVEGYITSSASGPNDISYYAPAVSGLGTGNTWEVYTATLAGTSPYTITLSDAAITTSASNVYTGDLTLVINGETQLSGSGHTAMPNFAESALLNAQDAHLSIGPATGTSVVGDQPVDTTNGLALAGYTGLITITESTTSTDQIELAGASDFFTLNTIPASTTTAPSTPATFTAVIDSNLTDTYTMTVEAPEGWDVDLDGIGRVTATPPLGAEPGDYTILVAAQSGKYPDLFVSAKHTVTITPFQGMDLTVVPDPLITTPWGHADPNVLPGDTNNGQVQMPGAAYTINITNTSTVAHTFDVAVSGLPDGWLILSGAEGQTSKTITLPPGGVGQVGLYIQPPPGALPPVGSAHPFTVDVRSLDEPSLAQSQSATFTVPLIAFSHVQVAPQVAYSTPGGSVDFDLGLRNVGNASGSFPLLVTQPISTWTALVDSPLAVDAGQTNTQRVTLQTPGGEQGRDYAVTIQSPSGAYTQTATLLVQMVSPQALAAHQVAGLANTLNDTPLAAALTNLGMAITRLEEEPTNTSRRDQVVTAIETAIDQLDTYPALPATAALRDLALVLRTHTSAADITADLTALQTILTALRAQLGVIAEYGLSARFTPGAAVTLPGRQTSYTLELANRGTRQATYVAEITSSVLDSPLTVSETLAPDQVVHVSVPITPGSVGVATLTADVRAVGPEGVVPFVQARTTAGLTVVDALVELTEVKATPDFVETGHNSTNLSMHVANIANWRMQGQAAVTVRAPDGTSVLTRSMPLAIALNDADNTFDLGTIDTASFASGIYTVEVELAIHEPAALADLGGAHGYALFSVGQGIQAAIDVAPAVVAPGDAVVTTTITTERTVFGSGAGSGPIDSTPIATQTLQLLAPANVSNNNPNAGALLHLEAGTYDVVIADGAMRHSVSGAWFDTLRASVTFTSTIAREYWLGYGVDAFTGGAPTAEEAIGANRGKFVRIHLPQAADVRFWVHNGRPEDASGQITLTVRKMFEASTTLNRQVEGALGWALPRQQAETLSFTFREQCMACHVQPQALIGQSDAAQRLGTNLSDPQAINSLHAFIANAVQQDGHVDNGIGNSFIAQTAPAFWSLARDINRRVLDAPPSVRLPGIMRYEETHPDLRFNGTSLVGALKDSGGWGGTLSTFASAGYLAQSSAPGDTITLTVSGPWVTLGFVGGTAGGKVAVAIDGVSQGTIDTYRRSAQPVNRTFALVNAGEHTITLTILNERNQFASNGAIFFDYIDAWDGTALPEGRFEERDGRVRASDNWSRGTGFAGASGGQYWYSGSAVWFPFTGDSVTYQAIASTTGGTVDVLIDGQLQGFFNLWNVTTTTRALNFAGLGAGPHILEVRAHYGQASVDAFITPGSAPFHTPPTRTGIVRHEEDDPTLRYNGVPLDMTDDTWEGGSVSHFSAGYGVWSRTTNDSVSLTFAGTWVAIGFGAQSNAGQAEILIDSVKRATVDTYSPSADLLNVVYDDLAPGSHTVTIKVLHTKNNSASDYYVHLDYIDTWDGIAMPDGMFEQDDQRMWRSSDWTPQQATVASGGTYLRGGSNIWLPFTGTSATFQVLATPDAGTAYLTVDGQLYDFLDLRSTTVTTRTFTLGDLPAGAHVLRIAKDGVITADSFTTPAVLPPSARHISASHSTTTVTTPHRADGQDAATVTVTVRDASGKPLAGKTVWAQTSDASDHVSASPVTTDASGQATFTVTSTRPGSHNVHALVVDGQRTITLPPTQVVFTAAMLSGLVFQDDDRDGVRASGEAGIPNMPIALLDASGNPVRTTTTAGNGSFTFTDLPDGTYQIVETPLPEFVASTPTTLTVTLDAFGESSGHLFGNYTVARIAGQVWNDANWNGITDPEEQGIGQVTVTLQNDAGTAGMATTDAQGRYGFAIAAPLPAAPNNFTFNAGGAVVNEPATARIDNGDFARDGTVFDTAAPENADFGQGTYALNPTTYPQNYNFETGDLTDWSASGGVAVLNGGYNASSFAAVQNIPNGYLLSSAFTVPQEAQTLRWWWRTRGDNNNYVYLLDESGQTVLRTVVNYWGGTNGAWRETFVDVSAFQGQRLRIKFANSDWNGNWFEVDDLALLNSVPGWTVQGNQGAATDPLYGVRSDNGPRGSYAFMHNVSYGYLLSPAFTVPQGAQTLRWWWRTRSDNNNVYLLDESGQTVLRTVVNYWGGTNGAWRETFVDVSAFQGQRLRIKFANSDWNGNWFEVDDLALLNSVPGWTVQGNQGAATDPLYGVRSDNGPRGNYAFMHNVSYGYLLSPAFTVPQGAQTLRWWWRTRGDNNNYVYLLDESGQTVLRTVVNYWGGTNGAWRETFVDVSAFQGQRLRIKFANSDWNGNWFEVDDLALLNSVPGWTVQGNQGAATDPLYGVRSDNGPRGNYAFMHNVSYGYLLSPAFTVPQGAQTLRWWWRTRSDNNNYVYLLDESGQIELRTVVNYWGGTNGAWQESSVDVSAFQGQRLRIKFANSDWNGNWFDIDDIRIAPTSSPAYTVQETNLPDWISSTADSVSVTIRGGELTTVNFGDYMPSSAVAPAPAANTTPSTAADRVAVAPSGVNRALLAPLPLAEYTPAGATFQPSALLAQPQIAATATPTDTEALLVRMADYMLNRRNADGVWSTDHDGPASWWRNAPGSNYSPALTAYTIAGLAKVNELTGETKYQAALLTAAQKLQAQSYTESHVTALHIIIGLHAALPHVSDAAQATQIEARMLEVADYLRDQQHADGGWGANSTISASDPLPTAGVLYALSLLQPANTDPALLSATAYLLRTQHQPSGQWYSHDQSSPIAPTTWVDISLPWIYELLSSYSISVAHRVPLEGVAPLPGSFVPPASTSAGDTETTYGWQYNQTEREPVRELSYVSELLGMRPGEVRQVTNGTQVAYTIEGGSNTITLPPQFVRAPHIIRVEPVARATSPGGTATYDVLLFNPGVAADQYTLSVAGLGAAWVELDREVAVGAGQMVTVPLTIQPSSGAALGSTPFVVQAQTSGGGLDAAQAELTLVAGPELALAPEVASVGYSETTTYTLTLTNPEPTARTYTLAAEGLGANPFQLPATLTVGPGATVTTTLVVTGRSPQGLYPFQVTAGYTLNGATLRGADEAVLAIRSAPEVQAALEPVTAIGGPGVPTRYRLTVTNSGSLADTYDFSVSLPSGWQWRLEANGAPVSTLSLTPYVFNQADLDLIIIPSVDAEPGAVDFAVTSRSQANPSVRAVTSGTLTVTEYGVLVDVTPEHTTMDPMGSASWQVAVTNSGSQPDTYDLRASGIISLSAQLAPSSLTLLPGETQTIQLTANKLPFVLAQTYPFVVTAQSRTNPAIANYDAADVTFSGYEAVQVSILPGSQTLTDTLQASYLVVITNTGNLDANFALSAVAAGLELSLEVNEVYLPAHMTAGILLTARGHQPGSYQLSVQAASTTSPAQGNGSGTLIIDPSAVSNQPPTASAGGPYQVAEGDTLTLAASGSDLEGGPLAFAWDLDDDGTFETSGQQVTFSALDRDGPASQAVAVRVTDAGGKATVERTTVTIENVAPTAALTNDGPIAEGSPVTIRFAEQQDLAAADTAAGFRYAFACDDTALDGATYATSSTEATTTCTFDDGAALHTVRARIIDKDGGRREYLTAVQVENVAPTAVLANDGPVAEGSPVVIHFSEQHDPSVADTAAGFRYAFACDNASLDGAAYATSGTNATTTCTFDDGMGSAVVRARIIDKDGGLSEYTTTVQVENVSPTATLTNDGPVEEGGPVAIRFAEQRDPSAADTAAGFHYALACDGASLETATYADSSVEALQYCTFDDGASSSLVRARIIDKDGGFTEYTTTVQVENVSPTATLTNDGPVAEGSPVTIRLSDPRDPSAADTVAGFRYAFACDNASLDDATYANSGTEAVTTCVFGDGPATHTVRARIIDKDGGLSEYTTTVQVENVAPTASFTNDGPVGEGQPVTIAFGEQQDPSVADTAAGFRYAFACDDASLDDATYATSGTEATTICQFSDSLAHIVRGRIIDRDGGYTEYTSVVQVDNENPTATLTNDGPVAEGSSLTLRFTEQHDPSAADTAAGFRYVFACDGAALDTATYANSGTEASVTCTFDDGPGTYTVRARIIDQDGGFSEYTNVIAVENVAPSARFAATTQVSEGGMIQLSLDEAHDPSAADRAAGFRYAFDCGDGYGPLGSAATMDCPARDNPSQLVRATIVDKDGGTTEYTATVQVENVAPSATLTNDGPIAESSPVTIRFTEQHDPSPLDSSAGFRYAIACDGSSLDSVTYAESGAAEVLSCRFEDGPGTYTVRARIIDKDSGFSEYTTSVQVENANPTAHLSNDGPIVEGSPVAVRFGEQHDPSIVDVAAGFRYAFACDGGALNSATYTNSGTSAAAQCTFTDGPSTHIVRARIIDKDGGFSEYTTTVQVADTPPPPVCNCYPIALHVSTLAGVAPGMVVRDIQNGAGTGNFGWLTWSGEQSNGTLVGSLTPPGDSHTYVNPNNSADHTLSNGDWARGRTGVNNSRAVRDALDRLVGQVIVVPVWDTASGQGANTRYHIVGFARVQISDYQLPSQNRISVIYHGPATCP